MEQLSTHYLLANDMEVTDRGNCRINEWISRTYGVVTRRAEGQ